MTLVSELSESQLLAAFTPLLPTTSAVVVGIGDDAAVVAAPSGSYVVSTDVLVEGHHFNTDWFTGFDVGYRAAMQNLADIAAMGGQPRSLVVGLVLPGHTPVEWVTNLAKGFAAACDGLNVGVVGGDLVGGEQLMVAVTVHGELPGLGGGTGHGGGAGQAVLRSGARPGDQVAVCGSLGRSGSGWQLLRENRAQRKTVHPSGQAFIDHFLRPTSPLAQGVWAQQAGATAMMDISDGLVKDAGRIAVASQVGIRLEPVLLAPFAQELINGGIAELHAWGHVLTGGEEHSLLATFPPQTILSAQTPLPGQWRVVGQVVAGEGVTVGAMTDMSEQVAATIAAHVKSGGGWDHFDRENKRTE